MGALGIVISTVLVISILNQTYSAPPIKPPKIIELPVKELPRIEFTNENIAERLQNDPKENSVGSSFETRAGYDELISNDKPDSYRLEPDDAHDRKSPETHEEPNGFQLSPLDLTMPKKKTQSLPRLLDINSKVKGKTIDFIPGKPNSHETLIGESSRSEASSFQVNDFQRSAEQNVFHFSIFNSLTSSKKRTETSPQWGGENSHKDAGSFNTQVRNYDGSALNEKIDGSNQLVNVENTYTGKRVSATDLNGRTVLLEFYTFNTPSGPKEMMYVPQSVKHAYYDAGIFETIFRTADGREFEWKTWANPQREFQQNRLTEVNYIKKSIPVQDSNGRRVFVDSFTSHNPSARFDGSISIPESLKIEYWNAGIYETVFRTTDGREFEWKTYRNQESPFVQGENVAVSASNRIN